MKPLENFKVVSLAINLPGPVAAARLRDLGAAVTKVEPPEGDPLDHARPDWYGPLHAGQEVLRLNLRDANHLGRLYARLEGADLLITASRPAVLGRLGLAWPELHGRWPRLCHVAVVGYPPPHEDRPGHDLNFQAQAGLVVPPQLPPTCLADMAGAQEVTAAALALLLARERGQGGLLVRVSLAEAALNFAEPVRHGLTRPGEILGGGFAGYNLYRAADGWIAVAALEPHFWERLRQDLGVTTGTVAELTAAFAGRTASHWENWAAERDLPITALRAV